MFLVQVAYLAKFDIADKRVWAAGTRGWSG
jgi:hypothetical protein